MEKKNGLQKQNRYYRKDRQRKQKLKQKQMQKARKVINSERKKKRIKKQQNKTKNNFVRIVLRPQIQTRFKKKREREKVIKKSQSVNGNKTK